MLTNHHDILAGVFTLRFKHSTKLKPNRQPDLQENGLKIWHVENGFICISPKRSFPYGNCRFIFTYPVAGDIAYLCTFEEIEPGGYRTPRNSGSVQIATNKNPVPLRSAIGIIYKELNKAIKYYSRINEHTKVLHNYATNAILSERGKLSPAYMYNGILYVLYVDYKCLRAEYKELISKDDIVKLYEFVNGQNSAKWDLSFGFTQEYFMNLIENIDK